MWESFFKQTSGLIQISSQNSYHIRILISTLEIKKPLNSYVLREKKSQPSNPLKSLV